jgi:hypothetical protein
MSNSTELVQLTVLLLAIAMTIIAAVRVLRQLGSRQKVVKLQIGYDTWTIDPSAVSRERLDSLLSLFNVTTESKTFENPARENHKPSKPKEAPYSTISTTSPHNANLNSPTNSMVREAARAAALAIDPTLNESDLDHIIEILTEDPTADAQLPMIFRPIAQLLSLFRDVPSPIGSTRSKASYRPRRAQLFRAVVALIVIGTYAAARVGAFPNPVQNVAHQIINVPPAVVGRASQPTQINANGIEFTTGYLNVDLYGHSFKISARDWNTITDESVVRHDIGVSLDPNIHPSGTSQNRFQYLADRMLPFIKTTFGLIGIVSVVEGSNDVTIAAIINPTSNTYQLSGLTLSVIESPPSTMISSATFYSTSSTALVIPGKTIYFAWLSSPVIANVPAHATNTSFDFHWDKLYDCSRTVCPRPSS